MKADVVASLAATPGITPHMLNAIQTELNAHPATAVIVNAHFCQENKPVLDANGRKTGATTKGKVSLHVDISPIW